MTEGFDFEFTQDQLQKILPKVKNITIHGYFQSEKFFNHCEDLVRKQFKFKEDIVNFITSKYSNTDKCLGVHVRRGDYVNQPNHHPVLPINYYTDIIEKSNDEYEKICVFSDDDEWVRSNFVGDKYIFPSFDVNNDLFSFILLSMMKDIVISNSTYSWWAAWLNKNKNKKIYSPHHSKWFGHMYDNLNTEDVIPEKWLKINF